MELFDLPGYFNFLTFGFLAGLSVGAWAMDVAYRSMESDSK